MPLDYLLLEIARIHRWYCHIHIVRQWIIKLIIFWRITCKRWNIMTWKNVIVHCTIVANMKNVHCKQGGCHITVTLCIWYYNAPTWRPSFQCSSYNSFLELFGAILNYFTWMWNIEIQLDCSACENLTHIGIVYHKRHAAVHKITISLCMKYPICQERYIFICVRILRFCLFQATI